MPKNVDVYTVFKSGPQWPESVLSKVMSRLLNPVVIFKLLFGWVSWRHQTHVPSWTFLLPWFLFVTFPYLFFYAFGSAFLILPSGSASTILCMWLFLRVTPFDSQMLLFDKTLDEFTHSMASYLLAICRSHCSPKLRPIFQLPIGHIYWALTLYWALS